MRKHITDDDFISVEEAVTMLGDATFIVNRNGDKLTAKQRGLGITLTIFEPQEIVDGKGVSKVIDKASTKG